ncbi:MAG TPA: hypothetical protein VE130_10300, partial [Nitrososphaeraceae archaeon]|nr:hypothetical protein [Nitrososphaeraceae archaeon]
RKRQVIFRKFEINRIPVELIYNILIITTYQNFLAITKVLLPGLLATKVVGSNKHYLPILPSISAAW